MTHTNTQRIRFTRRVVGPVLGARDGRPVMSVSAGDVLDCTPQQARRHLQAGRAEPAESAGGAIDHVIDPPLDQTSET